MKSKFVYVNYFLYLCIMETENWILNLADAHDEWAHIPQKSDRWKSLRKEFHSLPLKVLLYRMKKGLIPPSIRKEIVHG